MAQDTTKVVNILDLGQATAFADSDTLILQREGGATKRANAKVLKEYINSDFLTSVTEKTKNLEAETKQQQQAIAAYSTNKQAELEEFKDTKINEITEALGDVTENEESRIQAESNRAKVFNQLTNNLDTATTEAQKLNISSTETDNSYTITITDRKGKSTISPNLLSKLSIGTVTTGDEGTEASATITGTAKSPKLNLTIPRGNTGRVENTSAVNLPYNTIEDTETVYTTVENLKTNVNNHTGDENNPHEVTKAQVGLSDVPNVSTNNQTPTYTVPTNLSALSSGEKLSVAFGKIAKAVSSLISHLSNKSNPHGVTKSQVGLGNVENKSSSTIRDELTSSNVTKALGFTPMNQALKGVVNGVAELDGNGKVPSSQLPSFVDDVVEYSTKSKFPTTGESGKIYIDVSTNKSYRWSGSTYVEVSPSIALGETSSTAYRGDRGKIAYEHSQKTGNPHGVTKSDVGLGNVNNTSDADKTVKHSGSSDAIVPILLTDEDLNDVTSDNVCFYYAAGSNKVKNNPENIGSAFGLICYRSALGWRVQELYSQYGNKFIRHCTSTDGTTWQEWQKVLTNEEGTWTPTEFTMGADPSSIYYLHDGHYKKIGNIVIATCKASYFRTEGDDYVSISSYSLPFPIKAERFIQGSYYNAYFGSVKSLGYTPSHNTFGTGSLSFSANVPSDHIISIIYSLN